MGSLGTLLRKACRRAREHRWIDRLASKVFQQWYDLPVSPRDMVPARDLDHLFRRRYGLPFPSTHYYSPLPDLAQVKANLPRWYKESRAPGIDWGLERQTALAEELAAYTPELASLPAFDRVTKEGYGLGYGEVEAHLLYLMLRHLKPSRVVEVGSGVSTFYTLQALNANRVKDGIEPALTCVEPYPRDRLRELVAEQQVRLRACEVQDVEHDLFQELAARDVLFIDSSHVSKKDSDVDFLYLEVLPRLRQGVVVHIHDMPFPWPAIPQAHPLFNSDLFWNEAALVQAFLLFNSAFIVLMCQSLLHYRKPDVLQRLVPIYNPQRHFPSSLWLQRAT